jgi:hypothetical protein
MRLDAPKVWCSRGVFGSNDKSTVACKLDHAITVTAWDPTKVRAPIDEATPSFLLAERGGLRDRVISPTRI